MDKGDGILPGQRMRARGAGSNRAGRYEAATREALYDGWDIPEEERLVQTEIRLERPRSALSYNKSPDIPFDRSINPYRGCEHGCIYCFARPTHAYLNMSPGLDFETRLIARPGIGAVLRQELSAKRYKPSVIAIGTNTDPYQPCEAEYRVMREVLEVLSEFRHPVGIVTKGTLVERDLDILGPMAAEGLARVGVSVTTLDPAIARAMEPRVPHPERRLAVIRRLTAAGVPVRVMVAPIVPGLTDCEIEPILTRAAEAGAVGASWVMLRLPMEVAPLFHEWVETRFPDRAAKILARVRETHGGKDYDPAWGKRMRGEGIWSDLISQRFAKAVARLGLDTPLPPLRTDLFRVPPKAGDQMSLF
ncbi:MAG: radical SAM protein [Cereibacter sphaeroides]|uniref:Radical SAM protein n=1 Tax=Cereibacter sphaeroides TaxID=1063 RepID=A0A2W5TTJ5_CERSP|nr:MAG: radical SAM protein [Cereibacter sphaeroides]